MGASSRIDFPGEFMRERAAGRQGARQWPWGVHQIFIFLLHPYSIPAITKIRRVQAGR
jgi:hypothetical protein